MRLTNFFDLGFRKPVATSAQAGEMPAEESYGAVPDTSPTDSQRATDEEAKLYDIDWRATISLYVAVVAGIMGKRVLDQIASGSSFRLSLNTFVVSLILGAVGFSQIFRDRITQIENQTLRMFVAFESGFFIDSLVRAGAAAIAKAT